MRIIISLVSFFMILGQVGNLDLGAELTGRVFIKLLVLLGIFYLASKKYMK